MTDIVVSWCLVARCWSAAPVPIVMQCPAAIERLPSVPDPCYCLPTFAHHGGCSGISPATMLDEHICLHYHRDMLPPPPSTAFSPVHPGAVPAWPGP